MAYTVVQLDEKIGNLESILASGAEEISFEGRRTVYAKDIREKLFYFKGLRADLTATTTPAVRQLLPYTNNGL